MKKQVLSTIPFLLILGAMAWVYLSGVYHNFNFDYIQLKHIEWKNYIHSHPFLSALYFIGIYTVSVCLVVPDSLFLNVVAGFLFPLPAAIAYIVLSETLGATLFMCAMQAACKIPLSRYQNNQLARFKKRVKHDEAYYLLFFRFSHLLPFWLINVGSALMNVPKSTFIWTTAVGVLPLSIVMTQGGSGLSHYFDKHTHFSMADILTPQINIMLVGIGLLALLPLAFLRLKNRRHP